MEVLKDSFDNTDYQLAGHGPRNVKVLRQAFQEIDDEVKSDIYGKKEPDVKIHIGFFAFSGNHIISFC